MLAPSEVLKAKVCIVGEAGVGKTSLVRRFAYNAYDERYTPTLAAQVTKHEMPIEIEGTFVRVVLTLWDVMGEQSFLPLLEDVWLSRSQGVLAVADVTRPETFPAIRRWLEAVRRISGPVPVLVLANKVDLGPVPEAELHVLEADLGLAGWATSAKTGQNVGAAFRSLAEAIVRENLARLVAGPDRSTPTVGA